MCVMLATVQLQIVCLPVCCQKKNNNNNNNNNNNLRSCMCTANFVTHFRFM